MASGITIYIVGSMASGKTTLINAIMGNKLLPYASNASISIEYSDIDNFRGVAYGQDAKEIKKGDNISRHTLREWVQDNRLSSITVTGRIPFISPLNMNIRIVEVSSALWTEHRFDIIENTLGERAFIIFVYPVDRLMNTCELGLIKTIAQIGNNRVYKGLFFVVNRMDVLNPKEDDINKVLCNYKDFLSNCGIKIPAIFPISAQAALEARTKPKVQLVLPVYRQFIKHYPSTHYDAYYQFSHLPNLIRIETEHYLKEAENNQNREDGECTAIEIHSGIMSLEKAISLSLNKIHY